jgi:hypothetical protein
MNTPTENAYQVLHSDNTIVFETIESNRVSYEFQFNNQIEEQFENWKLEILETTDAEPTNLEILTYFKNLGVIGFSTNHSNASNIQIHITINK